MTESARLDVESYYQSSNGVVYWRILNKEMPRILLRSFKRWIKGQATPEGGVFIWDLQRFYDQLLEGE